MWKKTFVFTFLAQILSIIGFSLAMPFLPFFIAELGIHDKGQQAFWAGIVLGAAGVTLCLFAPLWGTLADRYGRKAMVCRSMFGGAAAIMLMSMSHTVNQLILYRLLQGVFAGTAPASMALVASVTPKKRIGFTLGMMQAAVFIGTTIGPLFGALFPTCTDIAPPFARGRWLSFSEGFWSCWRLEKILLPPITKKTVLRWVFAK